MHLSITYGLACTVTKQCTVMHRMLNWPPVQLHFQLKPMHQFFTFGVERSMLRDRVGEQGWGDRRGGLRHKAVRQTVV